MRISTFCKVLKIIAINGYNEYLPYFEILDAFNEYLTELLSVLNDPTVLLINQRTYNIMRGSILHNIINAYKHCVNDNSNNVIEQLFTTKYAVKCYNHFGLQNRSIKLISINTGTHCDFIAKIINDNNVKTFRVAMNRVYPFERFDMNYFFQYLNPNVSIETFEFYCTLNLDISVILNKFQNLNSLLITADLSYITFPDKSLQILPLNIAQIDQITYPNINLLSLSNFCGRLENSQLSKLMGMFPKLTSLNLRYSEIEDDSMQILFSTSRLITTLKLDECRKLSRETLYAIPHVYPNLKILKTTNNPHVDDEFVIHIVRQCKNLKDFDPGSINSNEKVTLKMVACVYKYFNNNFCWTEYSNAMKKLSDQEYEQFLMQTRI